jgi:hypothetical protein
MNPLLFCAIGLVRGWTRFYTLHMDPDARDRRRDEIESDLWEFHEDMRRRGASPGSLAVHMLARLVLGIPHDLLWRIEYEGDPAMTRRSTWMTAAAVVGTVCVAALWAFFAVTSLGALPPLPDSVDIERVYLRPMRPPLPPPPPPPPSAPRVPAIRMPPPPPPPR